MTERTGPEPGASSPTAVRGRHAPGLPAVGGRSDGLRRGVPAPARAAAPADALARPRRPQGWPAQRQARSIGRVRRLPGLHAGRRPPPARLERLRATREAVREAVRRGGGRHGHAPSGCLGVHGDRPPRQADVRQAGGRGPRLHRAGERGSRGGQRADRSYRPPAGRAPRLRPRLPPPGRPVVHPARGGAHRPRRRGASCGRTAARAGRGRPAQRPAGSWRRPRDPRARRDRLGADRPARAVTRRARPVARGRSSPGRHGDRRAGRHHRRPRDHGRLQGASRGLEGRLRRRRGEASRELRGPRRPM